MSGKYPSRMSCHRLTPKSAPRFGLYSARPGADLIRRPSPRRRVDHAPPHHLRSRDRAFRLCRRRFLPPHDRRISPRRPRCAPRPPGRDGGWTGLDGHARARRRRVGVAELEVPEARPRWGDDLRALDPDSEASGGRRRAHRDSGLAGGCAYHRRSAVRRGRRWGERDAKGDWDPQSACRGGRNPRRGDCRASQAAPPPHSRGRRSQERLRNQGRARGGGAIRGDPGSCGGFRAGCEWYETPASSPFPRLGAGSKRRYARAGGSARSLELP